MDIGADQITSVIVASTTDYISTYSSIFLLIGGIVLALGIIGALTDKIFPRPSDNEGV